ncbi:MsnO8 family LLM class oxidoreductase [Staphylococcus carnosus]|uniref:Oxidoreductase n=1 Tax=Staphylococcus carnosus TaxID=1281 RepID=A0AAJ0JNK0_STACA|nr:MsnO8 family LLM class oxidoreductase [Staphylococcus carnosus]KKB24835.1 oxidoreductase [Staphylococcus carnosus]POA00042.1 MsnO8 family LLM class oxidoreductase [Staphylococcus carnosus]QQS85734.1 MsnO8 family LLM class oxidoreductase [Staphylococcus carnosus]QRQ05671.1 MsnO8 family LLM class oxidoreductase [Staphylococcus carnosus]UTB82330.1 oxidoreductase [Staphylococcus carnosus]
MLPMSILDQTPINKGQTVTEALNHTLELAQLADQSGYTRYFLSEHHNLKDVVGTSPEILIMYLLDHTKQMRIGSGGVMLQHYHPLKVIEQFHLIDKLSHQRVDLAVGKAPGGYPKVVDLLQEELQKPLKQFDEKFSLLNQLNTQKFTDHSEYEGIRTAHRDETDKPVPVYLLGTSEHSAIQAAEAQTGIVYAYFINSDLSELENALKAYKKRYPKGRFIVSIPAVVTTDGNQKMPMRFSQRHYELTFEDGSRIVLNTKQQVDEYRNESEKNFEVTEKRMRIISGSKEEVVDTLNEINRSGLIDEWMLHMPVQSHKLRMNTIRELAPLNPNENV